ncbi:sugar ABC transporter ATP-binding protein [Aquamicrobium segne]|uniref:Sugar ABC transporter ATP-binding protein n=1 Tax=Aquamicrobium segne TaxID=469547 RepID=A0ABW0GU98_9HYPH
MSFGASHALRGVSADFHSGEVVALVGENGAGKSTLLKVMASVIRRTSGQATLDGKPYAPQNQREAEKAGVALVFQELNVNYCLSIAENIMLGRLRDYRRFGLIDWPRLQREAQSVLDRIGADFKVDDEIEKLDLGQVKTIEVARALATNPRFIFFDESTAFLNRRESARLMNVIRELKSQGIGIAFVSHHMHEVFGISDRLIVLKDGALVGSWPTEQMTSDHLAELMVGREMVGGLFPPKAEDAARKTRIEMKGVVSSSGVGPVDLVLGSGEIVGIGGLKGSGGEAILEVLAGVEKIDAGEIRLDGEIYRPASPRAAWASKVAHLPGDRTGEGVITEFSVLENITLAERPSRAAGMVDHARMTELSNEQIRLLGIKTAGPEAPVSSLSGGNMQKVVLGKCLATAPGILLLNNPTRGVDIGAKAEIYRVIRKLANEGLAVLMVSEDLHELLGLSDRVIVTRNGQLSQSFDRNAHPNEEEVVKWMM